MTPGGRKQFRNDRGGPVADVEFGGTNTEAGLIDEDHRVLARAKAATPGAGPEAVQDHAEQTGAAATPWLLTPHPELRFAAAVLGDDSGVVGAAALARARPASGGRPNRYPSGPGEPGRRARRKR